MKKIIIFLINFTLFVGCGDVNDDSPISVSPSLVVGGEGGLISFVPKIKWIVSEDNFVMTNTNINGKEVEYSFVYKEGHLFYNDIDYGKCDVGTKIMLLDKSIFIGDEEIKPLIENKHNN